MKIVAHISDPHFGTEDPAVTAGLFDELAGRTGDAPSLVLVSGDLTQRAKEEQFRAARGFLDSLPAPYLTVPGNHDVPLYDLWDRLVHPLDRYRKYVTEELMPTYADDVVAVVGLTTAHGFTVKDGKVTIEQALAAASFLAAQGDRFKMVLAHHPFVLPAGRSSKDRVHGAEVATPILRDAGAALVLSGHLHIAYASDAAGFRDPSRELIAVHAGTCTSTRRRGEPNGYNRLLLDGDVLTIQQRVWGGARFVDGPQKTYRRTDGLWHHADAEAIVAA